MNPPPPPQQPPPQPPPPVPPPPPPSVAITLGTQAAEVKDTMGDPDRAPAAVAITGVGNKPLTGLAVGTISYGVGASGWLTATLSGADAPATLTLKSNKAGIPPGTYTATIPITSSVASNSPQNLTVTLKLAPVPPPPGPTVTIVATGNLGKCGGDYARQSAAITAAAKPDYVFVLGDNLIPDQPAPPAPRRLTTLEDYMNCYDPTWGQFKSITYAALGEKEVDLDSIAPYGSGMAPGADAYFGPERVGPPGRNWYSLDLGSWHVVVLNVSSPGGYTRPQQIQFHAASEQFDWLDQDLRNHPKKCTIALFHEAMWISSTDSTKSSDPYPKHGYRVQDIRGIWVKLYQHNADLVINGGPHLYERFAPMKYDRHYSDPSITEFAADPVRGIRQITAGLAGDGPLVAKPARFLHPLSEYRSGGNGVLKLVLGDGAYTWEFLNTRYSKVIDQGRGTCH